MRFPKLALALCAALLFGSADARNPHGYPVVSGGGGGGATLVYNYSSGFASAHSAFNFPTSDAQGWSGSNMLIGGGGTAGEHQAGASWYSTQVNISSGFTQTFTFTPSSIAQQEAATGGGTPPNIIGFSFSVQDMPWNGNTSWVEHNGGWAFGDSNMAGFGAYDLGGQYPLTNIVSVLYGLNNYGNFFYSNYPNYTGLYLSGGGKGQLLPFNDLNPYGIQFNNGDLMSSTITYDNSLDLLTMVLTDTVTGAQTRQTWPVNIPAVIGSSTAWIGWTVGEIPAAPWNVNSASLWTGFNSRLTTPTLSPVPGSYSGTQSVTISCPSGATCYYTTNGLLPTSASTQYTSAISVPSNEVIQTVAIGSGYTDSLVGGGNYQISTSNPINFPSGFASGNMVLNGLAALNGSAIELTSVSQVPSSGSWNGGMGSAWFPVPVSVTSFTANFQLQWTSAGKTGMGFVIQNQTPASNTTALYVSGGPNALGGSWTGLGYASPTGTGTDETGMNTSLIMAFGLLSPDANDVGVYTNGTLPTGSGIASGLTFNSGHLFNCTVTYSSGTLSLSMTDATTSANFTHSWTENVPSIVGASTAYVGFTAGIGAQTSNAANQFVNSFTYSTP